MTTTPHDLRRATGVTRLGPAGRGAIRAWTNVAGSTYETRWMTSVQIVDPIGDLPRPTTIAAERTSDPRYYSEGRLRPKDSLCVFHFTLDGQGEFTDSRGTHCLRPGMGFLLEVNDPQICYGYPRGQTGTWEWMWIGFHGNTARMILRDLVARYGGVYNLGTGHPALRRLAAFRKTGFSTTRLHAMDGMKLVLDLLLALGQTARDGIHPENDLVARALRRMAGDDAAQIKISALAQELGVTREHLTRVFSREKGMGPQEYMLRQRIEHAMQILRESNLSVKEVADGLGFSSAAAFIRAFRRVQGGTPQAFRRL